MTTKNLSNNSVGCSINKEYSAVNSFSVQQVQNPLLPSIFGSYTFNSCRFEIPVNGKVLKVYLPKTDKILTEYANEVLPIYSTISFIELEEKMNNFGFNAAIFADIRLESAIALYCNLYNVSTANPEIRNILASYFSNSPEFSLLPPIVAHLAKLRNSLAAIEKKYLERLKNEVDLEGVTSYEPQPYNTNILTAPRKEQFKDGSPDKLWVNQHKFDKVLNEPAAQSFINLANSEILTDIKVGFETNRVKALGMDASIISDPRFRMSLEDPRWNEYDETIKNEVAFYNQKFSGTPGFVPLDWRYVKAMLWTEVLAGPAGDPEQWQKFPMQIGRYAEDAGYGVVTNEKDDADLIVSAELRNLIKQERFGKNNVKAGIAYLYYKAIEGTSTADPRKVGNRDVIDNPQKILTDTIQKGEPGFEAIAKRLGTTAENIKNNNPQLDSKKLQPGQEIKYQKAYSERYITGWRDWNITIKSYNSRKPTATSGDLTYMEKFNRAYQIIVSRQK
jgi:hypothetical protein